MDLYAPLGKVQHSGTFNAHLVPVLAGLAFMHEASKPYFYPHLKDIGKQLYKGINEIIAKHNLNMVAPHFGARFNILVGRKTPARKYEDTFCHNNQVFLQILKACYEREVYFHDYGGGPSHHGFSLQHTSQDIELVLSVLDDVLESFKDKF